MFLVPALAPYAGENDKEADVCKRAEVVRTRYILAPSITVFPILADVVEVKIGSRSTAHWSNDVFRLNRWVRNSFAQLFTPFDIDGIGQNWKDTSTFQGRENNSLGFRTGRTQRAVMHSYIADPPILSSSTRNDSWRYGSCGTGHLLVKRSRKQLLSTNLRRPIGSPTATAVQNRDPSFS